MAGADTKTAKPNWAWRSLWVLLAVLALAGLLLAAARVYITTDSGARFLERQINTRSFGPVQRLEISGLDGDPLKAFSLASVKIYDKDGLWATASNVRIDWNAFALLRRRVDIDLVSAAAAEMLRQPVFNPSENAGEGGDPYQIELEAAKIDALTIAKPVLGSRAVFEVSGGASMPKSGGLKAALRAARTDAPGDSMDLDFMRSSRGDMRGDFEITGRAGGPLAVLLRAPETAALDGQGRIEGTPQAGQADLEIRFGGTPHMTISGAWTPDQASAEGRITTAGWPLFDRYRRGLGETVTLFAELDRTGAPQQFSARATSGKLQARASGQMGKNGQLPPVLAVSVQTQNLGAVLPLPDTIAIGAASALGDLQLRPAYGFDGKISVDNIAAQNVRAAKIAGPLRIQQTGENVYDMRVDAAISGLSAPAQLPLKFAPQSRLKGGAAFDLSGGAVRGIDAAFTSGADRLALSGSANYKTITFNVSGKAGMGLSAFAGLPAGRLQSDFTAIKTPEFAPALSARGAFKPDAAADTQALAYVLGAGINFDIETAPIEGGLQIKTALITGENIRAALSGRAAQTLNIDGEAVLTAPLAYQGLELSGDTSASFRITGARDNPDIKLDASAQAASYGGQSAAALRLRADIEDLLAAPKGPLRLTGETDYGPLDFAAQFTSSGQAVSAQDIELSLGPLSAAGQIRKPAGQPVSGALRLNLPQDGDRYAKAALTLSAEGQAQAIALNIDAQNIAYENIQFESLQLAGQGVLPVFSAEIDARGIHQQDILQRAFALQTPLRLSGAAGSSAQGGGYTLTLSPQARYGNIELTTRAPVTAEYKDGDIRAEAPLRIAGAPLSIAYTKSGANEALNLKADDLPISLLPLPALLADTRGRIGMDLDLSANGQAVSGGGAVRITDWRGFEIEKTAGLSGGLDFKIAGNETQWTVRAAGADGFSAQGQGAFGHRQAGSIFGLRPDMDGRFEGRLDAAGDAAPLLGLITPAEAQPSGRIEAGLTLSGTAAAPQMQGRITGRDLQMEMPVLGTQIRKGRFTASFTNDTLKVTDAFLADAKDGTLSGDGAFTLGAFARPVGSLKLTARNFTALDRRDYEGRVDGTISFKSGEERAALEGDMTLVHAEVKQFVSGSVAVIEIPVTEIGAPEAAQADIKRAPPIPVDLNLHVRAPRRIFVRSRGLDVELSLDAKVQGTLAAPEIYGRADVLRGGYKIAGKTLTFQSGSIVFDGALAGARINLTAQTETPSLSAQLNISGTAETPIIELSSTPDRPQDEILSALLFGRSVTELSAIEAAQLAGALAQFSGAGGGFDLMGGLRDALGVGQLSIGADEDGNTLITGGRYLAENVYLQIFSGGGTDQTGAIIDWEIRKNLSLRSKIAADNEQAFSLKWKHDF